MATIHVTPREPGRLIVQFPYSPERVVAIKQIPGRQWNPAEKHWTVPDTPTARDQIRASFRSDRVVVVAAVPAASFQRPVDEADRLVAAVDEELTLRGYTYATRKNYRLQTQRFLKWLAAQPGCGPDPATATEKELRAYLAEILNSGLVVAKG